MRTRAELYTLRDELHAASDEVEMSAVEHIELHALIDLTLSQLCTVRIIIPARLEILEPS